MEEVRTGVIPFSKLDVLHRRNLERILPRFNVSGWTKRRCSISTRPGTGSTAGRTRPGLATLAQEILIAPCSNGNISLMCGIARRNHFPWDAILGSEVAGDYSPSR